MLNNLAFTINNRSKHLGNSKIENKYFYCMHQMHLIYITVHRKFCLVVSKK